MLAQKNSPAFILTAITVWLSFQYLIAGKYGIVLMGDEGDSHLSGLLAIQHAEDWFPYWSPYAALGTDRLALGYSPLLLSFVFQIMPGWMAYGISHIGMTALATVGMYLLCRRRMCMDSNGAYFAAFLFGAFLSFKNLTYFSIAMMPMVIVALSELLDNKLSLQRWVWTALAGIVFALPASMTFLVLFPAIFVFAWYLFLEHRFRIIDWLIIGLFFAFIYALRGQDILAMGLNAGLSQRSDWSHQHQTILEAVVTGVTMVTQSFNALDAFPSPPRMRPEFTTIAAYLASIGIIVTWRKPVPSGKLLATLLACALMVIGAPVIKSFLYDSVPLIRGFSMNKVWNYAGICFFVGAGFAVQQFHVWLETHKTRLPDYAWKSLNVSPLAALLLFSLVEKTGHSGMEWVTQGSYKLNYESPVISELAEKIKKSGERSRVASFQMYDVTVNAYGLESPGGKLDLFPKRYNQYWLKMVEPAVQKFPSEANHLLTYAYMDLGLTYARPDKRPARQLGELYRLNMFSLANVRYFLSRDRLTDPQLRQLDLPVPEKPWSALNREEKIRVNVKENLTGRKHVYVYENTRALPRFFLSENFVVADNRQATLEKIAMTDVDGLRRTMIINKADLPSSKMTGRNFNTEGAVHIVDYKADEITLEVSLNGEALLTGANSFSPYWKAYIDGQEAELFPAFVALWGLVIPRDARTIVFRYEPPYRLP